MKITKRMTRCAVQLDGGFSNKEYRFRKISNKKERRNPVGSKKGVVLLIRNRNKRIAAAINGTRKISSLPKSKTMMLKNIPTILKVEKSSGRAGIK